MIVDGRCGGVKAKDASKRARAVRATGSESDAQMKAAMVMMMNDVQVITYGQFA